MLELVFEWSRYNLDLLSPIFGILGTSLIFFYGIPPKVDPEGHINFILEQEDEEEKKKGRLYKKIGNLGLLFLLLSFIFQLLIVVW